MWRSLCSRVFPTPQRVLAQRVVQSQAIYCIQQASLSYHLSFDNDPTDYKQLVISSKKKLADLLASNTRFQRISDRADRSDVPLDYNRCVSKGRNFVLYRGADVCKCPVDYVLYQQLFHHVRPKTVIELGSFVGGSALWMADTLKLLDIPCQVYSMDLDLSLLSKQVMLLKPNNLTFLQGNNFAIEEAFSAEFLSTLAHPWVIIEDAHANMGGVLRYFHQHMHEGDYLAVEDVSPHLAAGVGMGGVSDEQYRELGPAKLIELRKFLTEHEDHYSVDSFITDLFGYNCSWHWHGFIRRMS